MQINQTVLFQENQTRNLLSRTLPSPKTNDPLGQTPENYTLVQTDPGTPSLACQIMSWTDIVGVPKVPAADPSTDLTD